MIRFLAVVFLSLSSAVAQNRPEIFADQTTTALPGGRLSTGRECAPDEAFRIGHGVAPPSVVSKVEPKYTEEAKKAKSQGTVVISGVIDQNGRACGKWTILRSLGLGLEQKAIEAISQWVFKPGLQNGSPAPVIVTIEVSFRLPQP